MTMNFNLTLWTRRLEAIPASRFVIGAAASIVVIGGVDHFSGSMTLLTIFYLVPVATAAWVVGRATAQWLALFAAVIWAVADTIGPLAEPKAPLAWFNDASILIVFFFINVVVSALREQVRRQRDLLQDVQRHLLPAIPRLANVDVASRWIPLWTVGGDYYDVIDAGPNQLALCLADVSGKGIAAALVMSNVQAALRALVSSGATPESVLTTLNRLLHQRLRTRFFVTMFFGVLDTVGGRFTCVNAGHNAPIVTREDGTLIALESTGPVVGILAEATYQSVTIELAERDRLVIYSDGVTEYENPAGEEFGEARLRELLTHEGGKPAEETCLAIVDALHAFGGGRPYDDDVTMLVVRRSLQSSMETHHATAGMAP